MVDSIPDKVAKIMKALKACRELLDKLLEQEGKKTKSVGETLLSIWEAYSMAEYALTLLKLQLGFEKHGEFINEGVAGSYDRNHLIKAQNSLIEASRYIMTGEYVRGFEYLRKTRNSLREILLGNQRKRNSQDLSST